MRFLRTWVRALYDVAVDESTHQLMLSVVLLLTTGTVFYSVVEGWAPIDSLYFSVITVTTVGYGDFAPTTDLGKLFTIVYVLSGISLIIAFANTVLQRAVRDSGTTHPDAIASADRFGITKNPDEADDPD